MMPSQSSSSPLHTSVPPPVPPTHCMVPAMHLVTPPLQWPLPAAPHGSPPPAPLSPTPPSQSSSMPLQVSGVAPPPPVHTSVPAAQGNRLVRHAPIELPHTWLASIGLSSTTPLQSSSRPLQRSGVGPTSPAHCRLPPTQIVWPSRHSPTLFVPHAWPVSVRWSSTTPSQSSSRPLQVSAPPRFPPWPPRPPPKRCSPPGVHTPIELPQLPPPSGSPSSIRPSQLSSMPLQRSTTTAMRSEEHTSELQSR